MKKLLATSILVFSGVSLLAQPASFGRELRKLLEETPPVQALSVASIKASPAMIRVASPTAALALTPAVALAPMTAPVPTTALIPTTALAPTTALTHLGSPVVHPTTPHPVGAPIMYPTKPILYPTKPISRP